MGTGPAAGWERHWPLLIAACAGTWEAMERCAVQSFRDVATLERAVAELKPPCLEWDRLQPEPVADPAGSALTGQVAAGETGIAGNDPGRIVIPLTGTNGADPVVPVVQQLARALPVMPSAVFMGGLLESPRLVLFLRPLKNDDFHELWSNSPA
jgi:hypothetical protein